MGMFTRAILMQGTRASGLNKVPCILKQLHNLFATTQVATLIQANILVRYISQETMKDKPMIKKSRGGALLWKHSPYRVLL